MLQRIDAWWRAANYLSVGQIYLLANPLLKQPLRREHVKPRLLGHWGTTPGLNFIYAHLNRVIQAHDLNVLYVAGPGHGGPGIVANTYVVNKKAEVIRVYLPPDANCLLSVTDHCLRSRNYVNVVIAGKQPAPVWLTMAEAVRHCAAGLGIWEWASNDRGGEPDVVMACCGDVPTLETLAAVDRLRREVPELKVRVVNVVDLMKLQPAEEHPHGLTNREFDALFTKDKPVIFAFHGYPWLIHRLTYRRTNHDNFHVRGYKEEGATTTPFDMCVLNQLDRFTLMSDALSRVTRLGNRVAYVQQELRDKLQEHREHVVEHGDDLPEIRDWKWTGAAGSDRPSRSGTPRRRVTETAADNV